MTAGWAAYAAAWAAFLASHQLPTRPALRVPIVAAIGERAFLVAYNALSVVALAWLVVAAGRAPRVPLWGWAWWQAWLVDGAMLLACLLLAFSLGRPNPFSIGGARNHRYDPADPGILALTRHPVLLALAIWSGAHLAANGDLAHVLLFGAFAAISLLGMRALDARRRQAWSEKRFALVRPRGRFRPTPHRLLLGLALWLLLASLHGPLIGASPWPVLP